MALDRCKETGAEIARPMNGNRHSPAILGEDVMAAMDAVKQPTFRFQLRDDFPASHTLEDRSILMEAQDSTVRLLRKRIRQVDELNNNGSILLPFKDRGY